MNKITHLNVALTVCAVTVVSILIAATQSQAALVREFNAADDLGANPVLDYNTGGDAVVVGVGASPFSRQSIGSSSGFFRNAASTHLYHAEAGVTAGAPAADDLADWTIEILLRRNAGSTAGEQQVFGVRDVGGSNETFINFVATSAAGTSFNLAYRASIAEGQTINAGVTDLALDEWHHLFFTYQDSTSGGADDGVLTVYDYKATGLTTTTFAGQDPFFGAFGGETGYNTLFHANHAEASVRAFVGDIGLFRIYDNTLTSGEAFQNYLVTAADFEIAFLPEPGTVTLMGIGMLVIAGLRRRKFRV